MTLTTSPRQLALRVLYLATLVAIVFPRALLGGWVGLATGGGMGTLGLMLLPVIGIAAWRFVHVVRNPDALASPPGHPVAATIRAAAVLLMLVSALAAIGQFLIGPITHALLGRADGGEAGVGYFVVGIALYFASGYSVLAILLFEFGRWVARRADSATSTTRRLVALAALICIAGLVLARIAAGEYVQSGRRALAERCNVPAEPIVKKQLSTIPTSVLVRGEGTSELRSIGWHAPDLAGASVVSFVEECHGAHCRKLSPPQGTQRHIPEERVESPVSPIELRLGEATVVDTYFSARLLRLRYEIRTTDTHEVLAEASEWVYDWGKWNRRGLMYGATRKEACGYAQAGVHAFRPSAIGNETVDAYTAADARLLRSIVPTVTD